jgi:hypothetical protein
MTERQNTLTCSFEPRSPKISAYEIHEWIHEHLRIQEQEATIIEIDGPKRQVFIKLNLYNAVQRMLQETKGLQEYKHSNGEISHVRIEKAGLGTKHIRIANLPPEVPEGIFKSALMQYREIQEIQEETWARKYR